MYRDLMSTETRKKNKLEVLRVRVTADELSAYDQAAEACGLKRSEWVRRTLHPERPTPRAGSLKQLRATVAEVSQLKFQLKQAGSNLNQLVRLVHERKIHTTQGSERAIDELVDLHHRAVDQLESLRFELDRHLTERASPW